MTALAQGMAGLALVMGLALLCTRRIAATTTLVVVQCGVVAIAALVLRQPLLAIPPIVVAAAIYCAARRLPEPLLIAEGGTERSIAAGGVKRRIAAGAALAILCQSQATIALPLAVVLLSILLAATTRDAKLQAAALVALQNGIILAALPVNGDLAGAPSGFALPASCLLLALALPASLVLPALASLRHRMLSLTAPSAAWIDFVLSLAIFAATIFVPLDSLASIFAPLLAFDGVLHAWQRRRRSAMSPAARGLALLTRLFLVLAVCPPDPILAWLAVLAAVATAVLPRNRNYAVPALLGAGIALFGLTLLPTTPSPIAWLSLFAGAAMVAAVVPDLAAVVVILLLRLAGSAPWPPAAEALAIAVALVALLACAAMLLRPSRRPRVTLLHLSQASIAVLAICAGEADGRFAALILLILLILTRSAARLAGQPVAAVATAGLGGALPFGVFPGLVLILLAIAAHATWLLLPLAAAAVPIVMASLPRRMPRFPTQPAIPSIGWLPLGLALLVGYAAPDAFIRWCHLLTAGR